MYFPFLVDSIYAFVNKTVALNGLGIKFINSEDKYVQQKVSHDLASMFAIIFLITQLFYPLTGAPVFVVSCINSCYHCKHSYPWVHILHRAYTELTPLFWVEPHLLSNTLVPCTIPIPPLLTHYLLSK